MTWEGWRQEPISKRSKWKGYGMQVETEVSKPRYPRIREGQGKRAQILAAVTVGAYAFWAGLFLTLILWGG